MQRLLVLLALSMLISCAPAPTLRSGDEAATQMYLALNNDVIVEAPGEIDYADVRLAADAVDSPYLVSPVRSENGYFALTYPDEENAYPNCLRIKAENVIAGWVGLTIEGTDYSESTELQLERRRAPKGC